MTANTATIKISKKESTLKYFSQDVDMDLEIWVKNYDSGGAYGLMENVNITLTKTDRNILESYKTVVEGLADYLGSGFELVLHSLENLDKSVIKIINGQYTGRKEGAPITDLALSMLSKINEISSDYISYDTRNKKGEPLKSTTIVIKGEKSRIIGLLCINFYMNTPLNMILSNLVASKSTAAMDTSENFADDVDGLIEQAVIIAKQEVELDQAITPSLKNKEIINKLCSQGIFKFKDSVIKIANLLGISKNTVYMHLRNINENN